MKKISTITLLSIVSNIIFIIMTSFADFIFVFFNVMLPFTIYVAVSTFVILTIIKGTSES